MVDVELVAIPPGRTGRKPRLQELTRRDFTMFFVGVGTTLAAFLFGWGMAALFRTPRSSDSEKEKDTSEKEKDTPEK
jgi:hypothetical protein